MEKVRFDDFIKLNRGFDLPDNLIEEEEPCYSISRIANT